MKIIDNNHQKKIIIPSDKNWFFVIVTTPIILLWIFVEIFIIPLLIISKPDILLSFVPWCLGWTFMGVLIIRYWLWHVAGRTVLTVSQDTLTIEKRHDFFLKTKLYSVERISDLHIQNRDIERTRYYVKRNYLLSNRTKTVAFQYENREIRAVDWLTQEDATEVMFKLSSYINVPVIYNKNKIIHDPTSDLSSLSCFLSS